MLSTSLYCTLLGFLSFPFLNFIKTHLNLLFLVVDVFCEEKVHGQESVSSWAVVVQRYVL